MKKLTKVRETCPKVLGTCRTTKFEGVSANGSAIHYVRYDTLYHRSLPSSCGDGRPVFWLRTRMGRLLSAARLDQRGASPRLASQSSKRWRLIHRVSWRGRGLIKPSTSTVARDEVMSKLFDGGAYAHQR